jgi:hypothetical protein
MALTPEQQAQVDMQVAIQTAINNGLNANQTAEANKQRRLEALRIAHTTLLENKRNLPVDQRQITADEITAFADTLNAHINA